MEGRGVPQEAHLEEEGRLHRGRGRKALARSRGEGGTQRGWTATRNASGEVLTIVSGYGEASQWYRNLRAQPDISIRTNRGRKAVRAELLGPGVGADVMADYARRNPRMAPKLMQLCGAHVDGSEADYREVAVERLRFVRLHPRSAGEA
ncbi:MAG: nitroreductase/quinone reductase family protein [Polyangiales bacterium]